ncbi:kinase-like protein [Choiromyces venosus 120613-1]|uniref:Kinase-like protein n=1 Tax=Choiromyces venosus 120613-1 TaxID=1336337 RepID=A0A3N4JXX8_9PEZI|nr:kinase-like protein [Choiromyces venosus 120613-1]
MATLTMADSHRADLFHSMYGYSSTSVALPPPVLLTSTWWDQQKIQEAATPRFIRQALHSPSSKTRLDEQLQFGEGLTESTYLDWIIEHTQKFFLILVELNCAEMIFEIIDGSWDDEDLPLSLQTVERLGLGSAGVEKKFAKKQYAYLVRELVPGETMEYLDEEVVPLEVISKRVPTTAGGTTKGGLVEKVYLPRQREVCYSRRRVLLSHEGDEDSGAGGNKMSQASFLAEISRLRSIEHPHIVSVFTSYTHDGYGYLVLSPCIDLTLKSFLHSTPPAWKSQPKDKRRRIIFNWLHCLADALAYLHEKGISHGDIKPSSLIIEATTYKIFFADTGDSKFLDSSPTNTTSPSSFLFRQFNTLPVSADVEGYEYGAPELWQRTLTSHESQLPPTNTVFSGRSYRKASTQSTNSNSSEETSSPSPTNVSVGGWSSATPAHPTTSDMFSLGCLYLDILSFKQKRKTTAFISHRSAKNRRPRESGPPDASFHANLGQVDSWIEGLLKATRKKPDRALVEALSITRRMLSRDPGARPGARRVADEGYSVVRSVCKGVEMPCCGVHNIVAGNAEGEIFGGWGVESLVLKTQTSRSSSGSGSLLSKRSTADTTASGSSGSVGSRRWMAV